MGRNVTQYKAVCWAHTNRQCLTLYTLLVSGALPSTGRSARRKPPGCVKKHILSALHCTKADALLFSVTEKQCLRSPASHKGAKTFVCSKTRQKGARWGGSRSDLSFCTARNISFVCVGGYHFCVKSIGHPQRQSPKGTFLLHNVFKSSQFLRGKSQCEACHHHLLC